MPRVLSCRSSTALSIAFQKLGQPVPLSNLVVDENRSSPQPAHPKIPGRCSSLSGLLKGVSVDAVRSTAYCWGVRSRRHSASVWLTSNVSLEVLGAPAATESSIETPPASTPSAAVPSSMRRRVRAHGRGGVGSVILPKVRLAAPIPARPGRSGGRRGVESHRRHPENSHCVPQSRARLLRFCCGG